MMLLNSTDNYNEGRIKASRRLLHHLHIDLPLLSSLLLLAVLGTFILYSASGQNFNVVTRQAIHLLVAFGVMLTIAQISPHALRFWAPWIFLLGLVLLVMVLVMGDIGKGARRWLDFGLFRFQPSEIMKLALPMVIAWYFAEALLPPKRSTIFVAILMLAIPTGLVAIQPDLGTSILIASAGCFVLFLAGLSWRMIISVIVAIAASAPFVWNYLLHDYQRNRVLTFINPDNDPLGTGYHIIQSTIAIGSGGIQGKGWLSGTQSHLDFLPERSTDFIFAVFSEEFGLIGVLFLLLIYAYIIGRGLIIASQAQDTFSRLLAGSLTLTFFVYVFVNMGMVSGILPVVGVPLPLVSYGGTSLVTLMAGFGILMSIQTHRKLIAN